ncbi:MAG: hypothetical protein R2883_01355 [Caldisericia bacterium]
MDVDDMLICEFVLGTDYSVCKIRSEVSKKDLSKLTTKQTIDTHELGIDEQRLEQLIAGESITIDFTKSMNQHQSSWILHRFK